MRGKILQEKNINVDFDRQAAARLRRDHVSMLELSRSPGLAASTGGVVALTPKAHVCAIL
jgi:hypothetical protein